MTLSDMVENAKTPTGETVDATSPTDLGKWVVGTAVFAGAVGLGFGGYNYLKSASGVEAAQNFPVVGDL